MNNITRFSNNIFNLNILSKKEFEQHIKNLVDTIYCLFEIDDLKTDINNEVTNLLFDFGVLDDSLSLSDLQKQIDKKEFIKLVNAINHLLGIKIENYPELLKYSRKLREAKVAKPSQSNGPTLVDLFSGSGGLSLGLVQAGFNIILANDIEKQMLMTYSFNHPEVDGKNILHGSIEDINNNIQEYLNCEVDLVVGGPPCQGFSMANRQRIIDDPRNVLYKEYIKCINHLHPKIFIMENVKGMLNVANQVVDDFNDNIGEHFDISYRVLNAKEFGVAQSRERLIFIGIRKDICIKNSIKADDIFEEMNAKKIDNHFTLQDALEGLKELKPSRKKNNTSGDVESGFIIERNTYNKFNEYLKLVNKNRTNPLVFNHKARYNNDRDIEIFGKMIPGDKSDSPRIMDIMPYKSRNHMFKDKYYKLVPSVPCRTITAHMKFDCNMYVHPFQARGLTPREAARIQSYPDDYFFLGSYTKTYQQIGNSVPPLLARKIGEILITIL